MYSMYIIFIYLLFICHLLNYGNSCYIQGTDSGECSTDTLDFQWKKKNMPYCAKLIRYPACLPKAQSIPPSIEFPHGRWSNHTILAKDKWIHSHVSSFIQYREGLEKNKTLRNTGRNEYGDKGHIARRFYRRPDCRNAYRNLVCWFNFPRCDPKKDLSLPTCRSSCENFFKSCHYSHDLWRCGESKYFNAYSPESASIDAYGVVTYLRDYFPGQPFVENKFDRNGDEKLICTPALTGAASHCIGLRSMIYIVLLCIIAVTLSIII